MQVGDLQAAMNDAGELRVMYELLEGDWITRCFVWYGLDPHGEMYRKKENPSPVPKEMVEQLYLHRSKLKTFFLLSRK